MAYLNSCTELDDLGKGRFRQVHHIKPIAYLENGVYKLSSANVAAYADGTYSHAVLTANLGVRIGNDGKYAVHPTRELARYAAFGGPQVKVGGKWTVVPFAKPVRKNNTVIWTREQADLRLTHIGHGLKHEMWLKGGYVPEDNLIAVAVNLVGLTRSGSTLLADGVPVARIQAPVVYDAANRLDTRPIKWDVVARDGQPYIVYTLPSLVGMTAPVVDPTLTLQPDAAAGVDMYVSAIQVDYQPRNYGVSPQFTMTPVARPLFRFNMAAIPATATCVSATFSVFAAATRTGSRGINMYQLSVANADFPEGTKDNVLAGAGESCWDAKVADGAGGVITAWAGSAGCSTAGTDYINTLLCSSIYTANDPIGSECPGTFTAAGILALQAKFGSSFSFIELDGLGGGIPFGYLSDHATASYRPKLVVDYTLPATGGGMLLLGVG